MMENNGDFWDEHESLMSPEDLTIYFTRNSFLLQDGLSESLFIVEPNATECGGERLCGVLSHTDILAFILSCEQQQLSGCNSISASLDRPE
jgi:hypothetical protein